MPFHCTRVALSYIVITNFKTIYSVCTMRRTDQNQVMICMVVAVNRCYFLGNNNINSNNKKNYTLVCTYSSNKPNYYFSSSLYVYVKRGFSEPISRRIHVIEDSTMRLKNHEFVINRAKIGRKLSVIGVFFFFGGNRKFDRLS